MLLNYLKLSLRLMARNPFFTLINIAGLSVGFTVFIILWQYAQNELRSDQQWGDSQRIARVGLLHEWSDDDVNQTWESEKYGITGAAFSMQLVQDFPELETYTRILPSTNFNESLAGLNSDIIVSYERPDQTAVKMLEDKVVMTDANVFEFFNISLIKGNSKRVLAGGSSVSIAESIAKKYFGNEEPLGKTLLIDNLPFEVTGVFPDFHSNTHLNFQLAISNQSKLNNWNTSFGPPPTVAGYIKSKEQVDWKEFESKINTTVMIEKYYGNMMRQFKSKEHTLVQPLHEISFSQKWRGDQFEPKSKELLTIFLLVGFMVLVLAFVNYISLNSARLKTRQKEVGTRKASGASSLDFIKQFTVESGLVLILSLAVALTLLQLVRHPLYIMLQIPVFETDLYSASIILGIVMLMVLLSASYPAYLSKSFKIRELLSKSNLLKSNKTSQWSFTSFQLSVSVILIIWGFIIYSQVTFLLTKDLGFEKENLLTINAPIFESTHFEADVEVFKNRLNALANVEQISLSTSVMGDEVNSVFVRRPGKDVLVSLDTNGGVDETFIPFYNIKLIAGRNFIPSDSEDHIIVSEGALSRLGFNSVDEALNATIETVTRWSSPQMLVKPAKIIGIIKGYRLRPMIRYSGDHDLKADAGIILTYGDKLVPYLQTERFTLRAKSNNVESILTAAQKAFEEIFPGNVFIWYFLDEHVNRHYRSEKIWRNQILFFTLLTIGIACLGVLGMISNKATEKTKEIGIRKVLGAEFFQISQLLFSTTFRQIIFSSLLGIPIAYYLTQQYLQGFSERIELHWWHFALPVVILILIMLGTVATVLWKAAKSNPVEALKYE